MLFFKHISKRKLHCRRVFFMCPSVHLRALHLSVRSEPNLEDGFLVSISSRNTLFILGYNHPWFHFFTVYGFDSFLLPFSSLELFLVNENLRCG